MGQRCLPARPRAGCPPCGRAATTGRRCWTAWPSCTSAVRQIDWAGFDRDYRRRRMELPSYPFQRNATGRTSAEQGLQVSAASGTRSGRSCIRCWAAGWWPPSTDHMFESQFAANRPAMLADHKIQGVWSCRRRLPGNGAGRLGRRAREALDVCDATLVEPLLLDKTPKTVQTILTPEGDQRRRFASSAWRRRVRKAAASGRLGVSKWSARLGRLSSNRGSTSVASQTSQV